VSERPPHGSVRTAAVVPALVAAWSWFAGHRLAALLAAGVALAVLVASRFAPGLLRAAMAAVARFAAALGRGVALVFAVAGLAVVVVPMWLVHRVRRTSPLADGWERSGSSWRARPSTRSGDGRPAAFARLGGVEGVSGPGRSHPLVRRVVLGVAALALVALTVTQGARLLGAGDRQQVAGVDVTEYAHGDEPWYGDHLEDLRLLDFDWDPIVGAISREHVGKTINVTDGRRASYQPAGDPDLTVWYFGGSTMFGVGQRDLHTLPSVVARLAEADGLRLDTHNFGIQSWVNWQETTQFALLLQTEPPPDVVVFYDGVNDLGLAFDRMQRGDTDPERIGRSFTSPEERRLWTSTNEATPASDPELQRELVASQYRRGVELGRLLAEAHGVEAVHLWQPDLVTKRYAPADQPAYDLTGIGRRDPARPTEAQAVLAQIDLESVIDLTGALDEVDEPVFWDGGHTNELGARVIGEAIYRHLEPVLRRALAEG
jgi:lysophospholipase L1-like esterase